MTFAERMLQIDRRIIFMVIGVCTLLPLLFPVGLPIKISQEVRGVYDYIEGLPEGSVFLLSLDFDPASKPELHPQAIAILRHAFRKNLAGDGDDALGDRDRARRPDHHTDREGSRKN